MRDMARRSFPSRALAAIFLAASIVLSLSVPLCADEVCPMSQAAKAAACKELGMDCCKPSSERVPHSPVQVPPPDPAVAAQPPLAATPTSCPARVQSTLEPATAPAIIQGVGFFTLFAVFLI
jgi:hypothetical protein